MSHNSEMATSINTRCHSCDLEIWVATRDFSATRNYCYTCAYAKLAYVPNGKDTHGKDLQVGEPSVDRSAT